jgi:hypothetical protein
MTPSTYDRTSPPRTRTTRGSTSRGFGSLTTQDIEKDISWKYEMVPGSLRFIPASTTEEQAMIFFSVKLLDGRNMNGRVEIRCLADETTMRIYPAVEVVEPDPLP